jgi:dihydrofolate reductase
MNDFPRPQTSAFMAVSLDGFIARTNGDVDWLGAFQLEQEDYGYNDFIKEIDVIVMGRHTYEKGLTFPEWPYVNNDVVVISQTLQTTQHGVKLHQGDIASLLKQLHLEKVKHVYIDGGITISQCLKHGLLDHMHISLVPLLLGSGIPLFKDIDKEIDCHLVSTQTYSNGIVKLHYELGSGNRT